MKQTAKSHLHLIIFHIQHPGQTYSMPFDKCHTNGLRQQLLQAHEKFDDSETKCHTFPEKNLSGTLVAYIIAPIMYKAPISAIHPTDA